MNKKENTNKIIIGLILLIILLLATTYAWFTNNKNVQITGINATVQTVGNLEISADAANWKVSLDLEEFKNVQGIENLIVEDLLPVSTTNSQVVNGTFFGATITNEDGAFKMTADEISANGKYIAFDLFFKSTSPQTVYISKDTSITSTRFNNQNNASSGIENAVRIAIVPKGDTASLDTLPADCINNLTGEKSESTKIFEPNYLAHTNAGKANASKYTHLNNVSIENSKLPYYGLKAVIPADSKLPLDNSTYTNYVAEVNTVGVSNSSNVAWLALDTGITRARIYIWLEGQDVDCIDDASGANFIANLKFTTAQ